VVAGGGNTAIDAARVALRLGARDALVVYRRTRTEMPAIAEEIEEALAEGVRIEQLERLYGWRATVMDRASAAHDPGEPDESGRARPVPVDGDEALTAFRCDTILLALGQAPDSSLLPAASLPDDEGLLPGVGRAPLCTAGDLVRPDGTVAAAIGGGRRAAWRLHAALGGVEAPCAPGAAGRCLRSHDARCSSRGHGQGQALTPAGAGRASSKCARGFKRPAGGEIAYEEAQRCFSCGACTGCGSASFTVPKAS